MTRYELMAFRQRTAEIQSLLADAVRRHQCGDYAAAEAAYGRILKIVPHHRAALYNLALLYIADGSAGRALAALTRLIKIHPEDGSAHYTLAKLLRREGALAKCIFHFRQALLREPDRIETYLELIAAEAAQGRLAEARRVATSAAGRFPGRPEIPIQLGVAAAALGEAEEAKANFTAALAIAPNSPIALFNLGKLADEEGQPGAALDAYRRAVAADPDFEPASFNLGDLALRLGDLDTAIATFDRATARRPHDAAALSNRLMAAQYQPGITARRLAELHHAWDAHIGGPTSRGGGGVHRVTFEPDRRLRVGLVSADLREHPAGFFIIRPIERLDRSTIETIAYNTGPSCGDALASRFKRAVRRWREAASWSDEQLAAAIADDRIDILIDLSGHTAGSRLAVFARRPAPVQLTWMGYVGTTGLKAMDGLVADRFHVPAGEEAAYVERVLRLPDTLFCFDPPTEAPAVSPLPASSGRPFCFGCFHNPAKINRGVADLWARILAAVPGASAYFAYAGYDVAEVQQRIRGWFADAGIAPDRIRFGGRLPRREHLARYGEVDLALDPFPYSGSTTTAEALWMGVPVVTMPGQSFAGRHSLSHLSVIGLTETIACDAEDYLARACGVAGDLDRLAILRAGLRERVAASPLCDGDRFARHLAAMLREVWLSRCEGAAARPQVSSQ